jgi:N-acetylglucosamine-6-phosphate deacetylase
MSRVEGHILTEQGFVAGALEVAASGRITAVSGPLVDVSRVRDVDRPIVLPGFVDLHVHGGGGHDVMDGGDAARRVAALHAKHGTTSLLATTMTAPAGDLTAAFTAVAPHCRERGAACARILGVHLEGPFINARKLGAQPDYARPLGLDEVRALNAIAPIRLVTLAPETPGHLDAIAELRAEGIVVQLGHTLASYEEASEALARGAAGFTHLFNAMSGFHHRSPGAAGAALAHAEFAEIIPDLLHVHPGAIRAALRAIPRLYCVTDSTAAAGMPDGEYRLGRQAVTKCMGGVRLADGTLAGSTLTMDQALRNLVEALGMNLAEASRRVSTHAAEYLGIDDRGRLAPGMWADIAVLDRDLALRRVLVEGEEVDLAHA